MEELNLLEKKVVALIELVRELKKENASVREKNVMLAEQIESANNALLSHTERLQELDQEKLVTKAIIGDLIKSIDSLVHNEQSQ